MERCKDWALGMGHSHSFSIPDSPFPISQKDIRLRLSQHLYL